MRHLSLFLHKQRCAEGSRCRIVEEDDLHIKEYLHPCPQGMDCKLHVDDPTHTKDYLHEEEPDAEPQETEGQQPSGSPGDGDKTTRTDM